MENHTRSRLLEQTAIATKLVADLPESLFEDPTTTFVDPAMGGGQYLVEVLKRCEKHHPREQVLPRLYGAESRAMFITRAKRYNSLEGANLTLDLNEFRNMQFDVVIGNPPYQDSSSAAKNVKLWPKFIKLSVELLKPGGFISLVTPGSWAVFDSSQSQRQRRSIIDHIDLQQVIDSNGFFDVGVSIVRWLGIKRPYSGTTFAWGVDHDFSAGPYLTDEAKLATAIHEKVKQVNSFQLRMSNGNITSGECIEDSGNLIYFSGSKPRYTRKEVEGVGVGKFVAPFSCSTYSRFYTTEAVGMLNLWMPATEEEAEGISAVWDLKVVRFFLDTYQKTAGFCNAVKSNLVPDLRGLDDDQAYTALGLTEEEVAVVEAHCS